VQLNPASPVLKVPAEQEIQGQPPAAELKVPGVQGVQLVLPVYPRTQRHDWLVEEPWGDVEKLKQEVQLPVKPSEVEKVPAGHWVQFVEEMNPRPVEKVPAGHLEQLFKEMARV
jgi:hypothetical protein